MNLNKYDKIVLNWLHNGNRIAIIDNGNLSKSLKKFSAYKFFEFNIEGRVGYREDRTKIAWYYFRNNQ